MTSIRRVRGSGNGEKVVINSEKCVPPEILTRVKVLIDDSQYEYAFVSNQRDGFYRRVFIPIGINVEGEIPNT
jgi:hypothetical protein